MRGKWIAVVGGVAFVGGVAWWRAALLDLPPVPAGTTLESAGLANLAAMRSLDAYVRFDGPMPAGERGSQPAEAPAAARVKQGLAAVERGDMERGLAEMREGAALAPDNLVLANAYRMSVFQLRRDFLRAAKQSAGLVPEFPPHLKDQPIAFFDELDKARSSRETKLNLALSWVDHMLLFPALEVKAPSSVEAVDLLTEVIDGGHPSYVPALFARGLNHLHRPARLVWPETTKTPKDAAVQDIGRCFAVGKQLGVGSHRLKATLALALGDAYVKAGRLEVARSWWQLAQNLDDREDDDVQQAVRRRYAWSNEEVLDRLEEELDRARSALDRPMTDLALMWR